MGHDTVKASRNAPLGVTPGEFENLVTVSYNFDQDANPDDVADYLNFVKDNSCIKEGPPAEPVVMNAPPQSPQQRPPQQPVVMSEESSSNVVALSTAAAVRH